MGRAIGSQIQRRLAAGPLVCAVLALSTCGPAPDRLVSTPFRLQPRQIARLTVRHTWFCAGGESLHVALAFSDQLGNTVARKEAILRCGDSAQLDVAAETSPAVPLKATVDLRPRPAHPPQVEVEVLTTVGPWGEEKVVYVLKMLARRARTRAPWTVQPTHTAAGTPTGKQLLR